jgi:hypothetical protein
LHCRRSLPTGHFLTNDPGHQRIKDQIGSAKPDTRVGAVQFGDDRMIGREIAGVIPEAADRAKSLNQPSGSFSTRFANQLGLGPPDPETPRAVWCPRRKPPAVAGESTMERSQCFLQVKGPLDRQRSRFHRAIFVV